MKAKYDVILKLCVLGGIILFSRFLMGYNGLGSNTMDVRFPSG